LDYSEDVEMKLEYFVWPLMWAIAGVGTNIAANGSINLVAIAFGVGIIVGSYGMIFSFLIPTDHHK
jgi:hypothetical protein